MTAMRSIADATSRPVLPKHVRLHRDTVRGAWALLSPEKILWPDEPSLAILTRCDGKRTIAEMSGEIAGEFDVGPAEIEPDVIAFVQDWSDRMVLKL